MRSIFRPDRLPDPAILDDHRPLIRSLERRGFLRGSLTLGALTMLTGCDVAEPASVQSALLSISSLNDRVQQVLFDPTKLAPTYPASMVLKPPRFNAYYDVEDVKEIDGQTWTLELSGLIADKRPWTLPKLAALPQQCLRADRLSALGQWGMSEQEAMDVEFGSMSRVASESLSGARRFADGAGRHGASE